LTRFRYRAISSVGDVVTGDLDAGSRGEAVRLLRERSLDPLSIREGTSSTLLEILNRDVAVGRNARLRLRLNFAKDLAVLREAGAPMDQALAILADGADAGAQLAHRVAQRTNSGMSLSAALRFERSTFDNAAVALVAAGEVSGDLAQALRTLAEMTEDTIATRSEMMRSLAYPAALITAALLAIGLMIFHVLPSFETLFAGSEAKIPAAAKVVFKAGHIARDSALPLGIATIVLVGLAAAAWFTERGRASVDLALLRIPGIGRLLSGLDLGRAMLIAGRLLASGTAADRAFELAGETCTNSVFRHDLGAAAVRIREGSAVAPALGAARFIPPRAVRMIAIGERSGSLPRMLGEVARMMQDSARTGIKALLAALPPVLTVVIGVLVAGLIYAVLTALLSVNELAF